MLDRNTTLKYWSRAAMIGAIYAILTYLPYPISYSLIQVRISEMLMILPYFTPAAVPGLFVGCLVANILGPYGIHDVIFGSLATLLSAWLVSKIRNKYLVPLPPVVINALVVGWIILHLVVGYPLFLSIISVAAGQLIACYGLGLPLLIFLEKRSYIFK